MAAAQTHSGSDTLRKKHLQEQKQQQQQKGQKKGGDNKRVVYKSVLDTPYLVKWPAVTTDQGRELLDQLVNIISPIGDYRRQYKDKSKDKQQLDRPANYTRVHVGLNQVTRFMEKRIQNKTEERSGTPVIFVCRREIKPVHLCSHLLGMAAVADIKLVPLPLNSESRLSSALGVAKASTILFECYEDTGPEETLRLAAQELPSVHAPWLTAATAAYQNTQVKSFPTLAPTKSK